MIRAAATLRKFEKYYNYVLSLDSNFRFWSNFNFQNQLVVSRNETIENKFKNGFAYYEELTFDNKNWDIVFAAGGISPGFKADLGYVPETDARSYCGDLEYSYFPNEKSIFWKVVADVVGWVKYDYEHEDMIEWGIEPDIDFCFRNKIDINVNANKEKVLYGSGDKYYNTHFVSSSIIINTFNTIGGNIWLSAGKSLWYVWDDPAVENLLCYGTWIYYRPNRHIDVNFSISYQGLKTFYNAQVYELRAKYQFNENFWVRGIFQVYDTDYEIAEQKHRSISFYPLFAYQPNANISLYLGATGSEHEGEDKIGGTKFLDSTNISYFFKITYAFDIL